METYAQILTPLAEAGVAGVRLDEPANVADRTDAEIDGLRRACARLRGLAQRPRIFVATYFGSVHVYRADIAAFGTNIRCAYQLSVAAQADMCHEPRASARQLP